eukprot:CAMPEP_0185381820 /NCGR_PEP_ID=MMETSP1364-20130426/53665_1 /TAXON_ID=38817 /ORGANISM="Gephyrocapsa oceanica, Strain RCC1303" /LENGTH=148 /DNA_ID=CAMNT_0027983487 /DNA_START=105 /DNA_END=547 /DNA_ORIENTATION=+
MRLPPRAAGERLSAPPEVARAVRLVGLAGFVIARGARAGGSCDAGRIVVGEIVEQVAAAAAVERRRAVEGLGVADWGAVQVGLRVRAAPHVWRGARLGHVAPRHLLRVEVRLPRLAGGAVAVCVAVAAAAARRAARAPRQPPRAAAAA